MVEGVCTMVANRGSGVNKKMLKNIYNSTLYEITTECEHINVEKKKRLFIFHPHGKYRWYVDTTLTMGSVQPNLGQDKGNGLGMRLKHPLIQMHLCTSVNMQ